jgi:hypothetical protein
MSTANTLDQRVLRAAQGVAVPAHTETELSVLARSIEARGGNSEVHDHHLCTAEDHIPHGDFNARDFEKRGWMVLFALTVIGLLALFGLMIARG